MVRTANSDVASTVIQTIVTGLQDNVLEDVNQDGEDSCVISVRALMMFYVLFIRIIRGYNIMTPKIFFIKTVTYNIYSSNLLQLNWIIIVKVTSILCTFSKTYLESIN